MKRALPPRAGRLRAALVALALAAAALPAPARQAEPQEAPPQGLEQEAARSNRPVVTAIRVKGQRRYSSEQLITALGQRAGQPLDPDAVREGVKLLWRVFRVRAEVGLVQLPGPHPGGIEQVELELVVSEMPSDLEPRFIGNSEVSTKTLLKWALLDEKTELFLHQAPRIRQRLLEGYQRDGFYWVEVNIVTRGEAEESAALSDVIFEIREGPRVRVRGVELRGNVSMPDTRSWLFFRDGLSHLAKRELAGKRFTNWFGSKFVRETLDADVLAMRQVYRDRGWLDAVVEIERLEFDADRDRVVIHIVVDEGQRYRVRKLSIEGYEYGRTLEDADLQTVPLELPEDDLVGRCKLAPGAFLEKVSLDRDREALREAYSALGRLHHPTLPPRARWEFLEPEFVFDVEGHQVDVIYRVIQGRRLNIREVQFAGTTHTRDRVLRREVSVFPGDQADLTEINHSLTRIHGTGFFNDEFNQFDHRDPYYRFQPVDGDPGAVDLVFEVQEGRVIDFSVSGGVDSNDGLFGLVTLSMRNFDIADTPRSLGSVFSETYEKEAFHGAGQRLDVELSPGTQFSRYRLHFLEPDLFRLHLNPISLDLDLTKSTRLYRSHDEDRLSESVRVGRKFTQDLSMSLGYRYSQVDVSDLDESGVPPNLAAQATFDELDFAGPTFDLSYRKLDNFIAPRQGFSLRWNNVFNTAGLGSDVEFIDSQVHWEGFRPIGEKADGSKIILHLGADVGVATPLGSLGKIPYSERYFLGGSSNMRGFAFRGVGPIDPASDYPFGGETYISTSLEWIYPLHSITQPGSYQRQEMLRGFLFTDWGVLDRDSFQVDADEIRGSVGFGIGLAYPLPLELSFGFPVVSQAEDDRQVFSFTLALF